MLLEGSCDCGLSGCGEAGEPDGEAFLLAVGVALCAGERWVPGDVAEGVLVMFGGDGGVWWGSRCHCG